jgi:nitrite reductase/ring-hydroxylating ferredoxin subunit/riboflavin synthase
MHGEPPEKTLDSEKTLDVDNWVPVALSDDLPDAGVMRAQVAGVPPLDLVVWRSRSGKVSAFDNRCPHRGMRLSFGFVRGERLSCIYHGWQYGEDGGCRHIPAHPDMTPPASICASTYPCQDHDGVIWLSRTDSTSPALPSFGGSGLRSLSVGADQDRLRELLMDTSVPLASEGQTVWAKASVIAQNQSSIVLQVETGAAHLQLMIHLQEGTDDNTMLHIQTSADLSVEQRIALSRWAERLRWSAENLGTVVNTTDATLRETYQ